MEGGGIGRTDASLDTDYYGLKTRQLRLSDFHLSNEFHFAGLSGRTRREALAAR